MTLGRRRGNPGSVLSQGVILSDKRAAALFKLSSMEHYVVATQGEVVGGWRIEEVTPTRVVLSNHAARRVLELKDVARPALAAPAAGAGAKDGPPASRADGASVQREEHGAVAEDGSQ